MIRFFLGPLIFGSFAFLAVFFIAPLLVAEADLVAGVAGLILDSSNRYFATTPSIVAAYIANLNLAIVAVTAGLLTMVIVQLLVIVQALLVCLYRGIGALLRWERKKEETRDLPPIEMDSRYRNSKDEKKVLGRGLDSIDRD